jgi:ABC-2 type transport system permease protein
MFKHTRFVLYRIIHNKANLTVYLILIPLVMGMAIYFTNHVSENMRIGIVGNMHMIENEYIQYTYLDEMPKTSQMVLNQYDAIVVWENQDIKVISTKGEEFNQMVSSIINGEATSTSLKTDERGNATQIIGFLMMVVSLLGVQIYVYYFDERNSIDKRILATSIRYHQYMLSHLIVVLCFLFLPAFIILLGAMILLHITLSIALWEFSLILFLLCFFAASFGLWINALSQTLEESMMFGNMFAIVATVVSGGFVEVTHNEIFNHIIQILPQRQMMLLLNALENGTAIPILGIVYVIVLSLIMIWIGVVVEKRRMS